MSEGCNSFFERSVTPFIITTQFVSGGLERFNHIFPDLFVGWKRVGEPGILVYGFLEAGLLHDLPQPVFNKRCVWISFSRGYSTRGASEPSFLDEFVRSLGSDSLGA